MTLAMELEGYGLGILGNLIGSWLLPGSPKAPGTGISNALAPPLVTLLLKSLEILRQDL